MNKFDFQFHFGYGSFMPILIFLTGIFIAYLLLKDFASQAMLIMLLALVLYVLNNIFKEALNLDNDFNDYLENFALFLTFGLNTIIYGMRFFDESNMFLFIVVFYSICLLLSLARNSILSLKNTCGWPIVLNGLFFPIIYYFYEFYLGKQGSSIFMMFYLVVSFLSVSKINFMGSRNKTILHYIEENNDRKRAEVLFDDMLKTDFKKDNLVGEVNDIFNGRKIL